MRELTTTPMNELTETETDHVAGGDNGNHFGQEAKEMGVPAWTLNNGNAKNAPGHLK